MIILPLLLLGCTVEQLDLPLTDAQNYSLSSELTADSQPVAGCSEEDACQDIRVDWSGLTEDIRERSLDPASELDEIRVVRFGSKTPEDILAGIATDSLQQSDITGFASFIPENGETSALLSDFAFFNVHVDPCSDTCPGMGTFLLAALTGNYNYRMFTFFEPTDGEPNTDISLDSDSATLTLTVDLESCERIETRRAHHYVIDWTGLTRNGYGNEIELSNIDQLLLARYEMELPELEEQFLHLEELPVEKYEAEVGGLGSFDLVEATDEDGEPFPGFEGDGTWLLALRCSTCINPAPLFLGIFD